MTKVLKKDEVRNMIGVLENVKSILANMQMAIELAEENTREFLPKMVKFNRLNEFNENEIRNKNNVVYKSIHKILFQYYNFLERIDTTIGVYLKSEFFLKDSKITTKIMELILGNEQFKEIEEILNNIEIQRKIFLENISKLKKIKSTNQYSELEEIFDYIGTLTFDNECTLSRFNKEVNLKIKELNNY